MINPLPISGWFQNAKGSTRRYRILSLTEWTVMVLILKDPDIAVLSTVKIDQPSTSRNGHLLAPLVRKRPQSIELLSKFSLWLRDSRSRNTEWMRREKHRCAARALPRRFPLPQANSETPMGIEGRKMHSMMKKLAMHPASNGQFWAHE